jgi:hypothetical protein
MYKETFHHCVDERPDEHDAAKPENSLSICKCLLLEYFFGHFMALSL